MNLDEQTTKLIRDQLHYTTIIKLLVDEIKPMEESKFPLREIVVKMYKGVGRKLKDRLNEVNRELRRQRIATWIEDQGDIVYVHVTAGGQKERYGVKKSVF